MDTDEAGRHTQSILNRVNRQQEMDEVTPRLVEISSSKPAENSSEHTLKDSDMETTILETVSASKGLSGIIRQEERLEEPSGGADHGEHRSLAQTLRHGTR